MPKLVNEISGFTTMMHEIYYAFLFQKYNPEKIFLVEILECWAPSRSSQWGFSFTRFFVMKINGKNTEADI